MRTREVEVEREIENERTKKKRMERVSFFPVLSPIIYSLHLNPPFTPNPPPYSYSQYERSLRERMLHEKLVQKTIASSAEQKRIMQGKITQLMQQNVTLVKQFPDFHMYEELERMMSEDEVGFVPGEETLVAINQDFDARLDRLEELVRDKKQSVELIAKELKALMVDIKNTELRHLMNMQRINQDNAKLEQQLATVSTSMHALEESLEGLLSFDLNDLEGIDLGDDDNPSSLDVQLSSTESDFSDFLEDDQQSESDLVQLENDRLRLQLAQMQLKMQQLENENDRLSQ
eukprot:TRINITY_DN12415_c0_g1_i2.p1 TRINITY_DN12415_c0_g1~~TRINITY_DN12415_c0_g1_i2.p1  ORF type:complete len:289 (-),score=93.35 TRINITY_DN12415_c0_g1_i2:7-873(-)